MSMRSVLLSSDQAYKMLFRDLMLEHRTAVPGIIKAVNMESGALVSVDVQIAIEQMVANADGISSKPSPIATIQGVPLVLPYSQGNGLSITIPIKVGDECLIIFADRSIDNWQFNGGLQSPVENTTPRSHHLTDAICIPGAMNNATAIAQYNQEAVEIRNKDHGTFLSLKDDEIKAKIGTSTYTMTQSMITLDAETVTITGEACNINSTTTTVSGTLVDSLGVALETHIHTDSQGGSTTPPLPGP